MYTIVWFAYFWLYLIAVHPLLLWARYLRRKGDVLRHDAVVFAVIHKWARRLLKAAGAKITVRGLENLPPDSVAAIYVGNHQGYFDIPLVLGYLGGAKGLVAKKEIKKMPLICSWMVELGCVFIDRDNPRASMNALNQAAQHVSDGYPMVVFPEGTRSKTGDMAEFKAGAFKIAQKNNVPVVPFFIEGTGHLLERNGYRIKPAAVDITVLPMIDTTGYTREDWKALPALAQDSVSRALDQHRTQSALKE
ncbi:MAG: lysophospholipid acyltransferase family protein [Candidatus Fimivivens sp.]|nr:lysophospholipid acyltransferase family protein [Candidatus Fimivivens sp.]